MERFGEKAMFCLKKWFKNTEKQEKKFRVGQSTGSEATGALNEVQETRRLVFGENSAVTGVDLRDITGKIGLPPFKKRVCFAGGVPLRTNNGRRDQRARDFCFRCRYRG